LVSWRDILADFRPCCTEKISTWITSPFVQQRRNVARAVQNRNNLNRIAAFPVDHEVRLHWPEADACVGKIGTKVTWFWSRGQMLAGIEQFFNDAVGRAGLVDRDKIPDAFEVRNRFRRELVARRRLWAPALAQSLSGVFGMDA
jgi:hypothetical protein